MDIPCFKPLHSGAFLLTSDYEILDDFDNCFKPLHSGAFLLTKDSCPARRHYIVSNPFIAGHSFLLVVGYFYSITHNSFKPLHSGAFLLTLVRTINVTFFADGCPPCRTTNDLLPGTRW